MNSFLRHIFIGLIFICALCTDALPANRYWVGGGSSANWNATGNTNWGTASNTQDNASVPGLNDDVFFDGVGVGASNSTLSANITIKSLNMTGYANTLTHNTSVSLTILGGSLTLVSGMTYSPASVSSSIVFLSDGTFTTGGKEIARVSFGGTPSLLGDNLTMSNLSGTSVLLGSSSVDSLDLNGKTISGYSATKRVLITSDDLGTSANLMINGGTFAYADFRDISADTSTDISAITGLSGDCGGNSNFTFTTAVPQYWYRNTGNWSDATKWFTASGGSGAGRIPLPQDDVRFDSTSFSTASQTVTADVPRLGRSISWSGSTNNGTWSLSSTSSSTMYGSLTLAVGMSVSQASANVLTFEGRSAHTITRTSKSLAGNVSIISVGGSITMLDSFHCFGNLILYAGDLYGNGFRITGARSFATSGALTKSYVIGSGGFSAFPAETVTWWNISGSNNTIDASNSTIAVGGSNNNVKTFAGAGLTYNNLTIYDTNTSQHNFTGSNTFNVFTINTSTAASKTVKFTAGTTTTIGSLIAIGTPTKTITIDTITAATHTLSKSSGLVCGDYLSIKNSVTTGGAVWYAGNHSTNVSGNTGWKFLSCGNRSGFFNFLPK